MPTDSVSETYGNQDGYTACGKRAIEIVDADNYAGFLTLDPDTGIVTIDAGPDDFGEYDIEVQIYLEEYPSQLVTQTITVNVKYCDIMTYEPV